MSCPSNACMDESSGTAATATTDVCAICLGDVCRGQAIFTAECTHTFHHRCISASVAHGHRDCPLCKATWLDLPCVNPAPRLPAPRTARPPGRPSRQFTAELRSIYDDDDELVRPQESGRDNATGVPESGVGEVVVKTHCERPAVPRDESQGSFPVLVHMRAPAPVAMSPARRWTSWRCSISAAACAARNCSW